MKPSLLIDTPLLAVLEEMEADLTRLRELAPHSDSCPTLETYFARWSAALGEARDADVWLSTEEAARVRGVTPAAITYLCRQNKLIARKRGGEWEIHKDSVLADTRRAA